MIATDSASASASLVPEYYELAPLVFVKTAEHLISRPSPHPLNFLSLQKVPAIEVSGIKVEKLPSRKPHKSYHFSYCRMSSAIIVDGDKRLGNGEQAPANGDFPPIREVKEGAFAGQKVKSVVIPASVQRIGSRAFCGCSELTELKFEDGSDLESIGPDAFAGTGVKSLVFPKWVSSLGEGAFRGCGQLESVQFDAECQIRSLPAGVFDGTKVKKLTIPALVKEIDATAIAHETVVELDPENPWFKVKDDFLWERGETTIVHYIGHGKEEVVIPESASVIGPHCFYGAHEVRTVVFPEHMSLQRIGEFAFENCGVTDLQVPTLLRSDEPDQLVKLYDGRIFVGLKALDVDSKNRFLMLSDSFVCSMDKTIAFRYLGNEEKVVIPTEVSVIGAGCFYGNQTVKEILFPESSKVKVIGQHAFENTLIEAIRLPQSLEEVQNSAFLGCKQLKTIDLEQGSHLRVVGEFAFFDCPLEKFAFPGDIEDISPTCLRGLQTVSIGENSSKYQQINGLVCSKDGRRAVGYFGPMVEELVIPDDIEQIGDRCFYRCQYIKSVVFPLWDRRFADQKLNSIGVEAFAYSSLESIVIQPSVCVISERSFFGCKKLVNLRIPPSPGRPKLEIKELAFAETALREFEVPRSIKDVDQSALKGVERITLDGGCKIMFNEPGHSSLVDLKIQKSGISRYYGTDSEMKVRTYIKVLGPKSFYDSRTIRKIVLHEKMTEIAAGAFQCSVLEAIEIPASIKFIRDRAFYQCTRLQAITFALGSSLQELGAEALAYTNIETFQVSRSVGILKKGCFAGCARLKTITFAEDVTVQRIEDDVFRESGLQEICIPNTVEVIGRSCFEDCYRIKSLTFQDGSKLTKIGDSAFRRSSLKTICLPNAELGDKCLGDIRDLNEVSFIPDCNLRRIEYDIFAGSKVEKFTIPRQVEYVNSTLLMGIRNVVVDSGNESFKIENRLLFNKTGNALIQCFSEEKVIRIPSNVESINENSFNGRMIDTVVFDEDTQLRHCGVRAFAGSTLKEIRIPKTCLKLEKECFANCIYLETVTFEEGSKLTEIGRGVFRQTAIHSITIPKSVERMGNEVFCECRSLNEVVFEKGCKVKELTDNLFTGSGLKKMTFPDDIEVIRASALIGVNLQDITAGEESRVVFENRLLFNKERNILMGCLEFEKIQDELVLPASVQIIQDKVFYGFTTIMKVRFEEGSQLEKIGEEAFANSSLQSIEIPKSVSQLGAGCFKDCRNLSTLKFEDPSKLVKLEGDIFSGTALKTINIPQHCNNIDGKTLMTLESVVLPEICEAFAVSADCLVQYAGDGKVLVRSFSRSQTVVIPEEVRTLGQNCFYGSHTIRSVDWAGSTIIQTISCGAFAHSTLVELTIPLSVVSIGKECFLNCKQLRKVTVEGTKLESIETAAFKGSGIHEFQVPKSVKTIGPRAFEDSALDSVTFEPEGNLSVIEEETFSSCKNLKEVQVPLQVQKLGRRCFANCPELTTVVLDNASSLEVIGEEIIEGSNVKSINIPQSVKNIHPTGLRGLNPKGSITTQQGKKFIKSKNFLVWQPDQKQILLGYLNETSQVNVPRQIYSIGSECFVSAKQLTYVLFDNKSQLEIIDERAFADSSVQEITIPESAVSLNNECFYQCKQLTTVRFARNSLLKAIGQRAFAASGIKKLEVPAKVQTIGAQCFNLSALSEITFAADSALSFLGESAFAECAIQTIKIPAKVTVLSTRCFEGCLALTTVEFEEGCSLETISDYAFARSTIARIKIPKSVTALKSSCFLDCDNLKEVSFENESQLQSIGENVFKGTNVKQLCVPPYVKTIAISSLIDIDKLELAPESKFLRLVNTEKVRFLISEVPGQDDAPAKKTLLACFTDETELQIHKDIQIIGPKAFSYCRNLSVLKFEPGTLLEEFDSSALEGLHLNSLTLPDKLKVIPVEVLLCVGKLELGSNAMFHLDGDLLYNSDYSVLYRCLDTTKTEVVIEKPIAKFAKKCFYDIRNLTNVQISDENLRSIGEMAFAGTSLESFTVPPTIMKIGANAFPAGTDLRLGDSQTQSHSQELQTWFAERKNNTSLQFKAANHVAKFQMEDWQLQIDKSQYETTDIGKGSYGMVQKWVSKDKNPERVLAAKTLNAATSWVATEPGQKAGQVLYGRELAVMYSCYHPCVCRFLGYDQFGLSDSQNLIIFMRYYPNGTLRKLLATLRGDRKPGESEEDPEKVKELKEMWTATKRAEMIVGIARGMERVHYTGRIHRDLKPDNILLDENYRPKISDFGTAKEEDSDTTATQNVGTAMYMAPEVCTHMVVEPTQKVDVFAFGLICYEILTGAAPFGSNRQNEPGTVMSDIAKGRHKRDIPLSIHPTMREIIDKCWDEDPQERPTFSTVLKVMRDIHYQFEEDVDASAVANFEKWVKQEKMKMDEEMKAFIAAKKIHGPNVAWWNFDKAG